MKNLTMIALIALTSVFAQSGAPSKSKKLTRAEFDQLLARPGQVLLIDVRRPDELTTVGGFPVYLSIQLTDVEKYLAFIPKDRTLITVSNHANRTLQAADLLDGKGFKVAGAIGVQNYEDEGGKLLKIAPPPAQAEGKGK
jgi:rhodanese-related sulfurtransferase